MRLRASVMAEQGREQGSSEATAARPGAWYADPYGQSELRWWDGTGWTRHVHGPETIASEPFSTREPPARPAPEPSTIIAEPATAGALGLRPVVLESVATEVTAEPADPADGKAPSTGPSLVQRLVLPHIEAALLAPAGPAPIRRIRAVSDSH